jgi:hypothetical protein
LNKMPKAKKKQIAYCGLVCTACLAYIATQADDDKQRKEVAEKWTKDFKHDFKPEDINCDGCLTVTGRAAGYVNVCPIRKCGREKGVINCAYCVDYSCDKTDEFFKMAPVCKVTLDGIKKGIKAK